MSGRGSWNLCVAKRTNTITTYVLCRVALPPFPKATSASVWWCYRRGEILRFSNMRHYPNTGRESESGGIVRKGVLKKRLNLRERHKHKTRWLRLESIEAFLAGMCLCLVQLQVECIGKAQIFTWQSAHGENLRRLWTLCLLNFCVHLTTHHLPQIYLQYIQRRSWNNKRERENNPRKIMIIIRRRIVDDHHARVALMGGMGEGKRVPLHYILS